MLQSAENRPSSLRSWSSGLFSLLVAATIVTLPFVQLTRETAQAEDKPAEKKPAASSSGNVTYDSKAPAQESSVVPTQKDSVGARNLTTELNGNFHPTKRAESFPVPSAIDQKILDALEKPTDFPVTAQEETVQNALNSLCEHVKLKWNADKKGLDEDSISLETLTVTAEYEPGVPLRQVLESILEPHGLTYQIRAGSLEITTLKGAARRIYLYPVKDLAQTDEQLRNLVRTLYMTPVLREQEKTQDDDTSVNVQTGTILMRQSFQSHLEVLDLLRTFRSAAAVNHTSGSLTTGITGNAADLYPPPKRPSVDQSNIVAPTARGIGEPARAAVDDSPWKKVEAPGSKPKTKQKLMYLDVDSDQEELLKLVKAYVRNEGRYPKNIDEFNEVLEKAGCQLIEPNSGFHYEIRPNEHLPVIVQNPKASPPATPVATPKPVNFMYLDLNVNDDRHNLGLLIRQFAKENGRYPSDLQECEQVLEKTGYKLMKLEQGSSYEYLKEIHQIGISRAKPKAPSIDPNNPAPNKDKKPTYLDVTNGLDRQQIDTLVRTYTKEKGRYPKDLQELLTEVLEKNGYKLIELNEGKTYLYKKSEPAGYFLDIGNQPKPAPAAPDPAATYK